MAIISLMAVPATLISLITFMTLMAGHPCSCVSLLRRARYLLDGANHVVHQLGGKFPTTAKGLLQIPGERPSMEDPPVLRSILSYNHTRTCFLTN